MHCNFFKLTKTINEKEFIYRSHILSWFILGVLYCKFSNLLFSEYAFKIFLLSLLIDIVHYIFFYTKYRTSIKKDLREIGDVDCDSNAQFFNFEFEIRIG